jgi:hypothetical protein
MATLMQKKQNDKDFELLELSVNMKCQSCIWKGFGSNQTEI